MIWIGFVNRIDLSQSMTKWTIWNVHPAKTQISLGIRPVWSESSLCAHWVAKDPMFLHANSEDSDQTGRMPGWSESSLGTQVILLVLSCASSICLCYISATGNRSALETEAKLKALLFGNADSNPSSGTASPGFSSGSPLSMYMLWFQIAAVENFKNELDLNLWQQPEWLKERDR